METEKERLQAAKNSLKTFLFYVLLFLRPVAA